MRKWLDLFESVDWMKAKSCADMVRMRDAFLSEPGIDFDWDGMFDDLPDCDDDEIETSYFDHCVAQFAKHVRDGKMTIYRAISVDDVAQWLNTTDGHGLGNHWSYDESCATTNYHPEAPLSREIMLVAEVLTSEIEWPTTFQQHFSHPNEKEITIFGNVTLLKVVDVHTGEVLAQPNRALAT